jgi:YVTN family beta-propeller protein
MSLRRGVILFFAVAMAGVRRMDAWIRRQGSPAIFVWLLAFGCLQVEARPFAYVANFNSNTVSVVNTRDNTVVATVNVGIGPNGVAITPNGAFAYVTNYYSLTVSVVNTASKVVVVTR